MTQNRGRFITFEGGEGAGKSTQIKLLAQRLRDLGYDVLVTREPGGSPGAESARYVLLSGAAEEFGVRMEAFLFAAARNDHVEHIIRPAIRRGLIVLCDRFHDSTRIYQGVTGNLEPLLLENLERIAVNGMEPDITLVIDVPAEIGMKRAKSRSGSKPLDRFEREELATHDMRRQGFLDLTKDDPIRCRLIDGHRNVDAIAQDVFETIELILPPPTRAAAKAQTTSNRAKSSPQ